MTYIDFLLFFVCLPISLLLLTHWLLRQHRPLPATLLGFSPALAIAIHILLAVIYTTPWDNYLVATRVWWYDPQLVTGIVLGWVPIEEYTFFVLQSLFAGLWLLLLMRLLPASDGRFVAAPAVRRWATGLSLLIWLIAVVLLFAGPEQTNYLALELSWAFIPLTVQLAFGADILWRHRRLVFWSIFPLTVYLSAADSLAIAGGTWTIDPAQSLQFYLGGILPVEELLFFLLTNTMLVFGMTLLLSRESQQRLHEDLLPRTAALRKQWLGRQH